MGTSFVEEVRDVWQMTDAQNGEEGPNFAKFQAQMSGTKRIQALGGIFQVGSSPINSEKIDPSCSDRAQGLVSRSGQNEPEFEIAG